MLGDHTALVDKVQTGVGSEEAVIVATTAVEAGELPSVDPGGQLRQPIQLAVDVPAHGAIARRRRRSLERAQTRPGAGGVTLRELGVGGSAEQRTRQHSGHSYP